MSEETSMTFKDIEILDFDVEGIELIAGEENKVKVPYILSDTPPKGWRYYFETRWPNPQQHVEIVGDRVTVSCRMDETAVRKNGDCWNLVAKQVDDANRHCHANDVERQQKRAQEEEVKRSDENVRSHLEEWKRNLKRRH
jgi:hypothetical protein